MGRLKLNERKIENFNFPKRLNVECVCISNVLVIPFNFLKCKSQCFVLLTLISSNEIQVITYGATITSVKTPDRNGVFEDIALGFGDINGNVQ